MSLHCVWRRSTSPDRSSAVTSEVIDGWVTPSLADRSVIRRGPVRSIVDSVASEVRLMSLGSCRTAAVSSRYRASAASDIGVLTKEV